MQYTAQITGNRRDTAFNPKALFLNIIDENGNTIRDHMWIQITELLERVQPRGHQKPKKVIFTAKQTKYIKQGIEQITLQIENIKRKK